MNEAKDHTFLRTNSAAVAVAAASVLPLFLVGALSVQLSADLGISVSALGATSAAFFATAALISPLAGKAVFRFGARLTMRFAILVVSATLLTIGLGVNSLGMLLLMLGCAGAGNALSQLSVNQYLAQRTSIHKQGTAYGIKQSAIPAAGMLAGLAVPFFGLTLGWRWTFALFAIPVSLLAIFTPGRPNDSLSQVNLVDRGSVPRSTLRLIALGGGLAAAGASCLTIFIVSGAVAIGLEEEKAGLIFAGASGIGIVGRLIWGLRADQRRKKHLETIALMLGMGAFGFFALASGNLVVYPIGAAIAFGWGWGWPGLLIHAVVRLNPSNPAAGTARLQIGTSAGCVVGPLTFGFLVENFSFSIAWSAAGVTLLFAGMIIATTSRKGINRRPNNTN